jgi:transcription termination factor NusB
MDYNKNPRYKKNYPFHKDDEHNPGLVYKLLRVTKKSKPKDEPFIDDYDEHGEHDKHDEQKLIIPPKEEKNIVFIGEKNVWRSQKLSPYNLASLLGLQILYGKKNSPKIFNENIFIDWFSENKGFFLEQPIDDKTWQQALTWATLAEKENNKIIEEFTPYLINWEWERLSFIIQSILKLAWVKIQSDLNKDISIIIVNAINQAKWFGEAKDYAFINSILDKYIAQNFPPS